jgi:hypothetical protein
MCPSETPNQIRLSMLIGAFPVAVLVATSYPLAEYRDPKGNRQARHRTGSFRSPANVIRNTRTSRWPHCVLRVLRPPPMSDCHPARLNMVNICEYPSHSTSCTTDWSYRVWLRATGQPSSFQDNAYEHCATRISCTFWS